MVEARQIDGDPDSHQIYIAPSPTNRGPNKNNGEHSLFAVTTARQIYEPLGSKGNIGSEAWPLMLSLGEIDGNLNHGY